MKPLGFIILAVILVVVVVGLTLACCYWCPDYYFSGCTPADILGKKKPSARYSTAPITDFLVGLLFGLLCGVVSVFHRDPRHKTPWSNQRL